MRFLLKNPVAQISGGYCAKWDKPGLESQKIPKPHLLSLTYRIFKKAISQEGGNSDEEGLGGRVASGEEEGTAGQEGFYSTVW